jgi:glycosyltransferase involved in cell wall biosynthesis
MGFLPLEKCHNYVSMSKICVLPTYHDIISGTILESMFLKVPVIAYSVGSIPELNEKNKTIITVPKGDIGGLSREMFKLLNSEVKRKELSEKAYKKAVGIFSGEDIYKDVINAYKKVIKSN